MQITEKYGRKLGWVSTSFSGFQDDAHWGQSLRREKFLVAVQISGEEATSTGNFFLKELQEKLEHVQINHLAELKQILSQLETGQAIFNYVVAYLNEDRLMLVIYGDGQAYIRREDKIALLKQGTGSISGKVKAGDTMIFFAGNLEGALTKNELISLLKTHKQEQIAQEINTKLFAAKTQYGVAGVVFHIQTQTPDKMIDETVVGTTALTPAIGRNVLALPKAIFHKIRVIPLGGIKKHWLTYVLVLLLVGAIGVGLIRQRQKQQSGAAAKALEQARHEYEEGMGLIDLNPVRARELLQSAQKQLTEVLDKETNVRQKEEITAQLEKVRSGIDFSLRRYESQPTPFYELSLLKEGGIGERMSLYKDALGVLDNQNSTLYLINISNKSGKILSGDSELKNAIDIAVHGEDFFVLSDKILKVETGKTNLSLVKANDAGWGEIKELAAYGGNLYLLDVGKNPPDQEAHRTGGEIWKYPVIESGFGAKQNYLLADEFANLTGATDMAIDGSIWVVKPGDILRFTMGREDVWQIKDLDTPLGKNLDIYTDDLTTHTYILDKDAKRVVVIDKDGVYLAQYFWNKEIEITDFVVSEVLKKILLLAGKTIYGIELK